ncbi:MAG: DUF4388 domain-containing protein [Coriobacteriia bacterium]|nr:DUF4388 domain-containing protein [Coriobacteriia bacterium]MBN2839595.1 DUF4388 domain-containing protein [Coriobacteriia bacterium]
MALRGNLKDFSLPDVFQLVQLSGKTGVLRIVRSDTEGSIWFRDGDVFFAQSNWRHELLGQRLVNAQRITPAALKRALEMHATEGGARRLGDILVSEGYITQQVLETFVQEQIEDTIFDIMRWDEGDFDFETLPEVVHEDIGLSVSVENIVMEGSRRLEEWNRIKKKVPSADMVFKMATAPGEGTFEISLKPIEWNLLLLIDGTRSVRDLALEVHSTDFEVARVIYGLFSAGLLEVPSDDEVERLRAERAARESKRERARAERAAAAPATEDIRESDAAAPEPGVTTPESGAAQSVAEAPTAEMPDAPAPEMPEFLSVAADAPSDDDMAVFTEMMEAVLLPHEAAQQSAQPAVVPEAESGFEEPVVPYVPDALDQWTDSMLPAEAADAETPADAGMQPPAEESAVAPGEDTAPADGIMYPDLGALSVAEMSDIPAPPVAEVAPLPEGFVPTGDYETDLRTLGLGEYPYELLEPEPVSESREPMSALDTESYFFESDVAAEAVPGVAPEAPVVDLESGDDWARFVETVSEDAGVPAEPVAEGGDDLDSLLESLATSEETPAGIISSGTDFGSQGEPGEYISTDSFLAEFDTGAGLSGGLGDELTALTGGGTARVRPVATVSAIPEPGEGGKLHIDQAVDRELLEKIIKGVEDL